VIHDEHLWVRNPGRTGASLDSYRILSDQMPPRLTEEEHLRLCQLLLDGTKEEKLEARRELTSHNLRLVFELGKTYVAVGFNPMIVLQAGAIAMFQALQTYDYRQGALGTYSDRPVRRAIQRAVNTSDVLAIGETERLWRAQRLLRQGQTLEQVAQVIGYSTEELNELLALGAIQKISIDQPIHEGDDTLMFGDLLESGSQSTEEAVLETELNAKLRCELQLALAPIQYRVVALRYGLIDGYPYSIDAISQLLTIPHKKVFNILYAAILQLRSDEVKHRLRPLLEDLR
ncbi:MAG TPA: hypothetical protein VNG90_04885, partial [Candidatus Acidoferrum sp.]|nr:hypothetical protein [Candidatus Acidoferrum sp.]